MTSGGGRPGTPAGGWERDLTQDELFELANRADPDGPTTGEDGPTDPPASEPFEPTDPSGPAARPAADGAQDDRDVRDRQDDGGDGNEAGDDDADSGGGFVPSGYRSGSWWFIRISSVVLVVLLLGNVLTLQVLNGGVHGVNWGVMAARWASPWWRLWDLALVWLGLMHGGLGLRRVLDDYAARPATRQALTVVLAVLIVGVAGTATVVALTFSPDI